MSLLFETIKIRRRNILNIGFHNRRINRTRQELFGAGNEIDLAGIIKLPASLPGDICKCKVIYSRDITEINFSEYHPKTVRTLTIVDSTGIDYRYKWVDRESIDRLVQSAATDDIIILQNGYVTDASFANLALFNGQQWITPATPLLRGTMREQLILSGVLREQSVTCKELLGMKSVRLINAMLDFNSFPDIAVADIIC